MSTNADFVAYYRVSTDRQGQSGLGLEAQREAVIRFTGALPILEYTEIESGKRHENRPQLRTAMDECKRHHHRLVIAKLDRLSRDPDFIGESSLTFFQHLQSRPSIHRPGLRPARRWLLHDAPGRLQLQSYG
jgi:DNA invertase Pin-like site-specific DNA recombinase